MLPQPKISQYCLLASEGREGFTRAPKTSHLMSRSSGWLRLGRPAAVALCAVVFFACGAANAQDMGSLNPAPLPPLAKPDNPATPAKELFARKPTAAALPTHVLGFYSKGCLAGAVALPINGK